MCPMSSEQVLNKVQDKDADVWSIIRQIRRYWIREHIRILSLQLVSSRTHKMSKSLKWPSISY